MLLASSALTPGSAQPARAIGVADCSVSAGHGQGPYWPRDRLDFTQAWPTTTGTGVLVAVIDTGLNTRYSPQLRGVHTVAGHNVIAQQAPGDTTDCDGHGTAVTGIIAAQPSTAHTLVGVAPGATIMPVKQTQDDQTGSGSDGLARAIVYAAAHGARVANVSIEVTAPTGSLRDAVAYARRKGMVIVAAAGNDGTNASTPAYPASYSKDFDNVIAVSAINVAGEVAQFSDGGKFVTVAAPGVGVPTVGAHGGYNTAQQLTTGTSFAAPFVTGTVALILAADPGLSPPQVRDRIEATADPPPSTVPSLTYGYGVLDPYLAVTAAGDESVDEPTGSRAAPVPAPQAAAPASRHVEHVAIATACVIFGLILLVFAGAATLRGPRGRRRMPA